MSKVTRITEYETLNDPELIEEVQQRRREIQQPKLDWKDHLSNFLISVPGIGGSVAGLFAFAIQIFKPPEDGIGFIDRLEKLTAQWKGREPNATNPDGVKKIGWKEAWKNFNEDPNFRKNVVTTTVVFAAVSAVSMFVVNKVQKGERAEDNATKHMFGNRMLKERGYIQIEPGNFVKRVEAEQYYRNKIEAEPKAEKDKVAQLEASRMAEKESQQESTRTV